MHYVGSDPLFQLFHLSSWRAKNIRYLLTEWADKGALRESGNEFMWHDDAFLTDFNETDGKKGHSIWTTDKNHYFLCSMRTEKKTKDIETWQISPRLNLIYYLFVVTM